MAKEIVTLCDACMDGDERNAGTSVAVSVDGKSRTVDLCEVHRKQLVGPLETLLEQHGARVGAPATAKPRGPYGTRAAAAADPDALVCPACGHKARTAGAMQKHGLAHHQATWDELRGVATHFCPQCGAGFRSFQGFGMHMRTAHQVSHQEARELADSGKAVKPRARRRTAAS